MRRRAGVTIAMILGTTPRLAARTMCALSATGRGTWPPVLENVFVPPPTNFGQKVPPKARNRDKADFATKVRKSSINRVNVNPEQ